MDSSELDHEIRGISALRDPVRRALYLCVSGQAQPVGRDEAAAAAGVSRALAAFHLDRLATEGLLEVEYRRLSGRRGPGAGRPAKLYRRSSRRLDLSLPERRYELVARFMAEGLERHPTAAKDARSAARAFGEELGAEARRRAGATTGTQRRGGADGTQHRGGAAATQRLHAAVVEVLADRGFDPASAGGRIRLRNCPFEALVGDHADVVCTLNVALMQGLVAGLGPTRVVTPEPDPQPGCCCVAFRTTTPD